MQRSFGLQISDLENSQSVSVQELTDEEAEKIVGGVFSSAPFDDPPCPGCYKPSLWSQLKELKTVKFSLFEGGTF